MGGEVLLVASVIAVGILHTIVPDHWAPIAVLARQRGWTRAETARAAAQAGLGHVGTTLLFGIAVWIAGAAAAKWFGVIVDELASLALIGFGLWIAFGAWREMGEADRHLADHHDDDQGHHHQHGHHEHEGSDSGPWARDPLYGPLRKEAAAERHIHIHRHGAGPAHVHWHDHPVYSAHAITAGFPLNPPLHDHSHGTGGRTALLLVLGSSPMVEGIPAFFAASRFGIGLLTLMALLFAASTIGTYVVMSVFSAAWLQRANLGSLERYGEVISGLLIALVGIAFGLVTIW
jgi:hypothetical protein